MDREKGQSGALPEAEAKRDVLDVWWGRLVFLFAVVVLWMDAGVGVGVDVDADADPIPPPGGTLPTRSKEVRRCLGVVWNRRLWILWLLLLFRGERKVAAEDETAAVEVV